MSLRKPPNRQVISSEGESAMGEMRLLFHRTLITAFFALAGCTEPTPSTPMSDGDSSWSSDEQEVFFKFREQSGRPRLTEGRSATVLLPQTVAFGSLRSVGSSRRTVTRLELTMLLGEPDAVMNEANTPNFFGREHRTDGVDLSRFEVLVYELGCQTALTQTSNTSQSGPQPGCSSLDVLLREGKVVASVITHAA